MSEPSLRYARKTIGYVAAACAVENVGAPESAIERLATDAAGTGGAPWFAGEPEQPAVAVAMSKKSP
jgi:hypothetical protein